MTSILVVCTGNICRSPIAEGFLRRNLTARFGDDAPDVSSAGVGAWDGNHATGETVVAAAERGVDIGDHRARLLTADQIEHADLIVCMAAEHRWAVTDLVPESASRTFTLKELVRLLARTSATNGSLKGLSRRVAQAGKARGPNADAAQPGDDIPDPLGQPMQAYRGVAWELDELVDRLDVGLFGPRVPS